MLLPQCLNTLEYQLGNADAIDRAKLQHVKAKHTAANYSLSHASCAYPHVHQAQDLHAYMSVHLKHFIELAHFEEHGRIKVAGLKLPPAGVAIHDIHITCHKRVQQLDAQCPEVFSLGMLAILQSLLNLKPP